MWEVLHVAVLHLCELHPPPHFEQEELPLSVSGTN